MTDKEKKQISKMLSLVLRHKPEKIGLNLDPNGWALISDILEKFNIPIDMPRLEEVVITNDKQRFSFNDDKTKIRANQGHSIDVDVELKAVTPPSLLYHGTVEKFVESIMTDGLKKMNRQYVHLSIDLETAIKVANRRGKAIVLEIQAEEMTRNGHIFYLSKNGVWLTDHVPKEYLKK